MKYHSITGLLFFSANHHILGIDSSIIHTDCLLTYLCQYNIILLVNHDILRRKNFNEK